VALRTSRGPLIPAKGGCPPTGRFWWALAVGAPPLPCGEALSGTSYGDRHYSGGLYNGGRGGVSSHSRACTSTCGPWLLTPLGEVGSDVFRSTPGIGLLASGVLEPPCHA
jgi:hypothetical protein